ncbi:MAG: DUF5675 family protein [Cyclobacteriaceae bacterium]
MNRFAGLLIIAFIALLVVLFIVNPQYLDKVWMWLVGFIGYIILLVEKGGTALKNLFSKNPSEKQTAPTVVKVPPASEKSGPENSRPNIEVIEKSLEDNFPKGQALTACEITILRYLDDGETTLGMIFLNNKFFSYTLEDTHSDEKISGNTRIPEGIYPIELNRNLTDLTQRYRNRFPWFEFHLEIKNIPNYSLVYIHIGNTHKDTRGCILIADGVNAASVEKMISHSQKAFERFYKIIYPSLAANGKMRIQILNENWFERVQLLLAKEKIFA